MITNRGKENKEKYELLQKQRSYERKMRALKRERLIAKETDDKENVTKINKKIKSTSEDFNKWLEDNNLTRDYNREYVEPKPIISKKVKDDELVIKLNYEKITKKWIDEKNNKENIVIKHKNEKEKNNSNSNYNNTNVNTDSNKIKRWYFN